MPAAAPKRPKSASAPSAPKKPTSKSKTGNSACSQAASNWQLAIRGKATIEPDTYKTLAKCRGMLRTSKAADGRAAAGYNLSDQGAAAIKGRLQSRFDRDLVSDKSRAVKVKELLAGRAAKQAAPVAAKPAAVKVEKTKEQIKEQSDRIAGKSRAESGKLFDEKVGIHRGSYAIEDKINRARSEKGKAKAEALGKTYVDSNQPRLNAIDTRRDQLQGRIAASQLSSEYLQQPSAVRARYSRAEWGTRTQTAEAKAMARQDAIENVIREGTGNYKYGVGKPAYNARQKRFPLLSGQPSGGGALTDSMALPLAADKQYPGIKDRYINVRNKMIESNTRKFEAESKFKATPDGYRQSVREEALRKHKLGHFPPRRDAIGSAYPTAILQREADVNHERRVLGKQKDRAFNRSSMENKNERIAAIRESRKGNTEDVKRKVEDKLYDAVDDAKRYAPKYKTNNSTGGALFNQGSGRNKLSSRNMIERQEAASEIRKARQSYQALPEIQTKISEQNSIARERSRARFPIFGGQLPDERPFMSQPSPKQAKPTAAPALDHGTLNVPLSKRGNIDNQLDRHKQDQQTAQTKIRKQDHHESKAAKDEARRLYGIHGPGLIDRTIEKNGGSKKEAAKTIDQLIKWQPKKALSILQKVDSESSASAPAKPKYSLGGQKAPGRGTADRKSIAEDLNRARNSLNAEANLAKALAKPQWEEIGPGIHKRVPFDINAEKRNLARRYDYLNRGEKLRKQAKKSTRLANKSGEPVKPVRESNRKTTTPAPAPPTPAFSRNGELAPGRGTPERSAKAAQLGRYRQILPSVDGSATQPRLFQTGPNKTQHLVATVRSSNKYGLMRQRATANKERISNNFGIGYITGSGDKRHHNTDFRWRTLSDQSRGKSAVKSRIDDLREKRADRPSDPTEARRSSPFELRQIQERAARRLASK